MSPLQIPMINSSSLLQYRNNRLAYYLRGFAKFCYPRCLLTLNMSKYRPVVEQYGEALAHERLDYYNKLNQPFHLQDTVQRIKDISFKDSHSEHLLDFMEYGRFFSPDNRVEYLFRDVIHVPDTPTIVKSRPVADNRNSVLLKLNKVRHFLFVKDRLKFRDKQNRLIWRGAVYQPHRIEFMENFFQKSDLLDVGQYNKKSSLNPHWQLPFMTIEEQLQYKFILSIEGNDVATCTIWAMSSNSLVFMIKPKYETWFMEGRLIPGFHYVLVKDDYSDLESLVEYYIDNPNEAETIIKNAQQYVKLFQTPEIEDWLGLKVLKKYFQLSGQL